MYETAFVAAACLTLGIIIGVAGSAIGKAVMTPPPAVKDAADDALGYDASIHIPGSDQFLPVDGPTTGSVAVHAMQGGRALFAIQPYAPGGNAAAPQGEPRRGGIHLIVNK